MGNTLQRVQPGTNILQPWTAQQLTASADASTAIRSLGRRFQQQIFSTTIAPGFGATTTVNVPIQQTGLITKFTALVSTVVTNPSAGSTLTRTGFGAANQLSQISFTDPQGSTRIQCPGWLLKSVTAKRHRRIPGAALSTDSPSGFGSVIQPIAAPSTIAANATATVADVYEIPLAFSRNSLKGAVFAGAVFQTMQLQLQFNPNFCSTGTDPLGVGYTGAAAAPNNPTFSTTITVFQDYWDQFPLGYLSPLSPDMSTEYCIQATAFSNLVANADNYIGFTNLRQFFSTVVAYDNGGTMNAGSDITSFMLRSANQTPFWYRTPALQSYMTRNAFGDDWPAGFYLFDFTEDPVVTAAEGNTVLSVKPNSVSANSQLVVGWEYLAASSVIVTAPGLAGNAGVVTSGG